VRLAVEDGMRGRWQVAREVGRACGCRQLVPSAAHVGAGLGGGARAGLGARGCLRAERIIVGVRAGLRCG